MIFKYMVMAHLIFGEGLVLYFASVSLTPQPLTEKLKEEKSSFKRHIPIGKGRRHGLYGDKEK